jgi:O-antigen ligase
VRSRYAHNLPLEVWAELGIVGLAVILALYVAVARAAWRARVGVAGWLLGPAAVAFLATNLIDLPWHLAGAGALWAVAVGGLVGAAAGSAGAGSAGAGSAGAGSAGAGHGATSSRASPARSP